MKRFRLLSRLVSAGMLSAMVGTLAAQVAQAQRPIPWSELNCISRGKGGYAVGNWDISVGRELYTSVLVIAPNAAFTCRLPGGPASLRLEFAIPDEKERAPIKIDVYVDGNQVASRIGDKGKVHTLLADVSNGRSLALEVSCAMEKNCSDWAYYFMKAQIEPGARSPGSR